MFWRIIVPIFHVNRSLLTMAAALSLLLASSLAWSHYPWVIVANDAAQQDTISVQLGWGHSFPNDGNLASNRVYDLRLFSADGAFTLLTESTDHHFDATAFNGPQMVSFQQARSFYSQTRQGGRPGNKSHLAGVLSCSFSNNSGKALIGGGSVMNQPVNHALEIIPLSDLNTLAVGQNFPIQVLWHDQPFAGTVQATSSSHAAVTESQYPIVVETNSNGVAEVLLTQAGYWMFKATAQSPFYDNSLCDTNGYLATLTFWIQR